MKRILAGFVLLASAAVQAATVGKVVVRQQWPWSETVKIEYMLSGASAAQPVDIRLACFNGADPLACDLHNAVAGDVYGIVSDGVKVITIDPVRAFGSQRLKIENFRVTLTPVASEADIDEELYRIYDLTAAKTSSGTVPYESVTRKKILNGEYGTYETDYSKFGDGFTTPLKDVLVWTGVTNDIAYKTTKLVMRRIRAKGVTWNSGSPADELGRAGSNEARHSVILTNDYLIGVFELTKAQYARYYGTPKLTESNDVPVTSVRYAEDLRAYNNWSASDGSRSNGEFVNWPTNAYRHCVRYNRMIGLMRTKTGVKFDIPTEAQWEYACRAGSTNALYSGKELTEIATDVPDANSEEIAWTKMSGKTVVQQVGLKAPNAWGIYDMLGNAAEWCLDWYYPDRETYFDYGTRTDVTHADPLVDPVGRSVIPPDTISTYKRARVVRGGSVASTAQGARAGARSYLNYSTSSANVGVRLTCPVGTDWDLD